MLNTIIGTSIGVLVGGLVTWLTAWYYYRQAAQDLNDAANRFEQLIDETFTSLERAGWLRVTRDDSGRPVGIAPRFRLGKPSESPEE